MAFHPLQNPLILGVVFRHCPNTLESVKIRRSVCRAWRAASDLQWRALVPLTIHQDPQHAILEPRVTSICEVVQGEDEDISIFPNINLRGWSIDPDHFHSLSREAEEGYTGLHQRFWNLCAQTITTLTLSNCRIPAYFTLLPLTLLGRVPNLETLTLKDCQIVGFFNFEDKSDESILQLGIIIAYQDFIIDRLTERKDQAKNRAGALKQIEMRKSYRCGLFSRREALLQERPQTMQIPQMDDSCKPFKLKTLRLQNVECRYSSLPIEWSMAMHIFPNLERILIHQQELGEYGECHDNVEKRLKQLDMLNTSICRTRMPNGTIWMLPTEKFSFDCGFETNRQRVRNVLERQADGLNKLVLFRAPFSVPFSNFPLAIPMSNLTKLHLWGNMSRNMNFLRFMPNLKKLKWNTICYDDKTQRARLRITLEQAIHPVLAEDIVQSTNGLGDDFMLESLEAMEWVSRPLSERSLTRLSKWFPNLRAFKVAVQSNDQLPQIANQWPNLESLEIAHGSEITTHGILNVYIDHNGFPNLRKFTWKACRCTVIPFGVHEMHAEHRLRRTAGDNVVHPWKRNGEILNAPPCLQRLFEKAVVYRGENIAIFLDAVDPAQ